jgi:cyclopropane-fatty-acyl-phospholipid synthase
MVQRALIAKSVPASGARAIVEDVLSGAGIRVDGTNPWDLRVHDERFFARALSEGTLGLGESYMDGWWDASALDQFMERALRNGLKPTRWDITLVAHKLRLMMRQSLRRSRRVAHVHYDLGNDFFARMLGPSMTYSCGYWPLATNLEEAQDHKHDLVCEKLGIERRHRVLDIGCGWGRLLAHAHARTGCTGLGVTISEAQHAFATETHRGLPIGFELLDYRDRALDGPFDRIVSVGMFEHVGTKGYRDFFARASELLKDDGIFLLHTMGNRRVSGADPWIDRYIFPNGIAPCASDVARAWGEFFVLEDWHSFGPDYDKTLMEWSKNFEAYASSADFPFDRRFHRMWRYYLLSFAGSFRARNYLQLWQIVLSKRGLRGGYRSIR